MRLERYSVERRMTPHYEITRRVDLEHPGMTEVTIHATVLNLDPPIRRIKVGTDRSNDLVIRAGMRLVGDGPLEDWCDVVMEQGWDLALLASLTAKQTRERIPEQG